MATLEWGKLEPKLRRLIEEHAEFNLPSCEYLVLAKKILHEDFNVDSEDCWCDLG